jgi:hypothetical protein
LTSAAEFPFRPLCRLPLIPFAQLFDESGKFQQICHAKERRVPTDEALRVRRSKIRPLRRNSTDGYLIDVQQEPSAIPGIALAHAHELLAAEWREGARDTHRTRRGARNPCILE